MSKRFTDSRKWDDDWFLGLKKDDKLLWIYLLDKCDHTGIFKPNLKLLNFCLESTYTIDDIMSIFNNRLVKIEGDKIFIPKFISFQYGHLSKDSAFHNKIRESLKENRVSIPCQQGSNTLKVTYKDKVKVKDTVNKISNEAFISSLKANIAYKGMDIDKELAKMDTWLLVHKGRKKTRRFIANWLNRAEVPLDVKQRKERYEC